MTSGTQTLDTGMYMRDLLADAEFATRKRVNRHPHAVLIAMKRLTRAFAERPEDVLQELVDIAVDLCGAESAGISKEEASGTGKRFFRWVAISGSFSQYVNGTTPRFFSPCGVCLDGGRAQLYRVTKPYYDYLGVTAQDITDGMLIPWADENIRGTIWAVAHNSFTVFDANDYRLLSTLAELASVALCYQVQQERLRQHEEERAAGLRAFQIAKQMRAPLESLWSTLALASEGREAIEPLLEDARSATWELSQMVDHVDSLR